MSIIVYCVFILIFPFNVWANGAAAWPGIRGNEITVSETKSFDNLIVDEEVVLDGINNTVSVKYTITNTLMSSADFVMIFPIGENCLTVALRGDVRREDLLDEMESRLNFTASLNGSELDIEHIEPSKIKLSGAYSKLKESLCSLQTFSIKIQPGNNILDITYKLVSEGFQGDGIGEDWEYRYYIWPAKNWVTQFRHALWRVILPKRITNLDFVHRQGEWYTGHYRNRWGWYKNDLSISAPGTRRDYSDHVDFTADNFVPSGQIVIKSSMRMLSSLVKGCEDQQDKNCEQEYFIKLLRKRPFTGSTRCYDLNDVGTVAEFNTVPYLRNEIYARKGLIFKTEAMKIFFSKMPWYKPSLETVQLNDIEEWNVRFLKAVENSVKSYEDEKKLPEIFHGMRSTCPGSFYELNGR